MESAIILGSVRRSIFTLWVVHEEAYDYFIEGAHNVNGFIIHNSVFIRDVMISFMAMFLTGCADSVTEDGAFQVSFWILLLFRKLPKAKKCFKQKEIIPIF